MRALGQNPVNAEVLKVLGNPKAEGQNPRNRPVSHSAADGSQLFFTFTPSTNSYDYMLSGHTSSPSDSHMCLINVFSMFGQCWSLTVMTCVGPTL